MSEWETWSDGDDLLSWKSLCLSELKPRIHYDDTESEWSVQEVALPTYVYPSVEEREMLSTSQWIYPTEIPKQRLPVSLQTAQFIPAAIPSRPVKPPSPVATPGPSLHLESSTANLAVFPLQHIQRQPGPSEKLRLELQTAKCASLKAKVRELESRDSDLQAKVSSLEIKLKAMTDRHHEAIVSHQREMRIAEEARGALESQLQVKEARVVALEAEEDEQKKITALLEAKIDTLQTQLAEKGRSAQIDAQALARKDCEMQSLLAKLDKCTKAEEDLRETLKQNNAELDRLRKEFTKAQFELSRRKTEPPAPAMLPPPPPDFKQLPVVSWSMETPRAKSLSELGFTASVRKVDDVNSSANVRNLLSYQVQPLEDSPTAIRRVDTELSAPFATEKQTIQTDVLAKRELEAQLLQWHIQKAQLQAEYAKLEQMGFRTIEARRRKSEIETSLDHADKHISHLKLRLK
ncbi:hypothetical protein AC1031_014881 [Aphanomyces cochlioides]|nr:hypothetical protein AC1031_014881 [Aphanomyces cochlioides]